MEKFDLDPRYRWYRLTLTILNRQHSWVFRGATVRDMRRCGHNRTEHESETFLLEQCVLPQQDWEHGLAGVSRILLEKIARATGLDGEEYPFQEAATWLGTESGALEAVAVSMISGLTFEHLDTADPAYRARYLAVGKFMFESLYNVSVFDVFLPADKQKSTVPGAGLPQPRLPAQGPNMREESSFAWVRPKSR